MDQSTVMHVGQTLFMDYPFLNNDKTVHYVGRSKTIFYLRGLPGSGKSTLARAICDRYPGKAVVCSAQCQLPEGEKPPFSTEVLQRCHADCLECVTKYCKEGKPVVIVDNTNLALWEIQKYGAVAHRFDYMEVLVEPNTPWRMDPEELVKRSNRGFSVKEISAKLDKFKTPVYPLFYGWFVNDPDSVDLRSVGQTFYDRCLDKPVFEEEFTKFLLPDESGKTPDPHKYFSSESYAVGPVMLHCTAFFSNNGSVEQSAAYAAREAVKSGTGKAFNVNVIGLLITPRSLGFRLKLEDAELPLWFQEDAAPASIADKAADSNAEKSHTAATKSYAAAAKSNAAATKSDAAATKSDDSCIITPLSPTCGTGSRAHFSLGSGPGVDPVQTGLDLVQIIKLEQEAARHKTGDKYLEVQIEGGLARCYRDGNWMVYFKEPSSVESLFSGFY